VVKNVDFRFDELFDDTNREIFATTYAVVSGNKMSFHYGYSSITKEGAVSMTRMIDAEFSCITSMVSSLRTRDGLPPNGYSTNCVRSFNNTQEEPDDE